VRRGFDRPEPDGMTPSRPVSGADQSPRLVGLSPEDLDQGSQADQGLIACCSVHGVHSVCFARFVLKGLNSSADVGTGNEPRGRNRFCWLVEFLTYPQLGFVSASFLERLILESALNSPAIDVQLAIGGHAPLEHGLTSLLAQCPLLVPGGEYVLHCYVKEREDATNAAGSRRD
jgi:hypothetical protein